MRSLLSHDREIKEIENIIVLKCLFLLLVLIDNYRCVFGEVVFRKACKMVELGLKCWYCYSIF
ncbi:TPA: hypothetical protein DDW69_03665 [candidate division CPR2 bacterium]|nr:MAG: hypothetical protein A2Y26_04180 [candidate division CPR2 bacterium GWD2_39_7]HBG81912.1 hypothetical protein [candidate division CPR2 bacterium]HCL99915.1 hypothetical protein [candidate division CPR2 bacterium]